MVQPRDKLHIYLRVSSDAQEADGYGLEIQRKGGLAAAKQYGLEPIVHEEGSASSFNETLDNRPAITNLMRMVADGEVKHLYVYNTDRLSRNEQTAAAIRFNLQKNKVKVYHNNGVVDLESPSDKLLYGILAQLSVYDNEIRLDRLRKGRLESVRKGRWHGGRPPFGYSLVDGYLVENEDESEWVRKIYRWYDQGVKIDDIRLKLLENGVRTRAGLLNWGYQSIRNILESTIVDGVHHYSDKAVNESVTITTPQIVDPVLSKSVKDKVSKTHRTSNNVKHETLLKGLLRCGCCGSPFGQRISKVQYTEVYFCLGNQMRHRAVRKGAPKVCQSKDGSRTRSVKISKTDDIIWNGVVDCLSNSSLYKEFIKQSVLGVPNGTEVDPKALKNRLKKIDKDLERLRESSIKAQILSSIDDTVTSTATFNQQLSQVILEKDAERQGILKELKNLSSQKKWVDWLGDFRSHIDKLTSNDMSQKDKKRFLSGIIDEIVVTTVDTQTHQLDVHFRLPFVGSELSYRDKGKKTLGYDFVNGGRILTISSQNLKKTQ
jgi:site-specific DNA recombinase